MRLINLRPMLETADLRQTIKFYTELLGFECQGLFPNAENPCWASLQRDDVEIMFTTRNAHSAIEKPTMTGSLYLNPDNVNEAWEQLKNKVTIEYPIEKGLWESLHNAPTYWGVRTLARKDRQILMAFAAIPKDP